MGDQTDDSIQSLYQKVCHDLKQSKQLEQVSMAFGKLKSDEERVNFVLNMPLVEQVIQIKPSFTAKSSELSTSSRSQGNNDFQKKLLHKSLEDYTQSILLAPEADQKTTALAYANRSAVLFHFHEYKLCLRDIQMSLDFKYPQENRYKLLDRKGRCLNLLGKKEDAGSAFEEALKCLPVSNLKGKDKISWQKQIEKKTDQLSDENMESRNALDVIRAGVLDCPRRSHGINDTFPAASKAFDITVSPLKGRYPIASQDIQIGDVLLVEKPFASVLLPDHYKTHCHHCLVHVVAPLPCRECATVRYCSQQCAEDSWVSYHSVECKYLEHIHSTGKYGHLALRVVITAGLRHCREIVTKTNEQSDLKHLGCDDAGVYDPSQYYPIYNLVGHTEERSVNDLFRRTVIAVYLLKCIQKADFFDDSFFTDKEGERARNKSLAVVGGIILRHLQSFPCNAHEISELQLSLKSVATSETMELGAGIYATLSLFNHSCEPNVTRFFYNNKCVVRALRSIQTGQEIADNYGVLSAVTPREQRRGTLASQYYFLCECNACNKNAPMFSEIRKIKNPILRCEHCGFALSGSISENTDIVCKKCKAKQDIALKKGALAASEEAFSAAINNLLQDVDIAQALPQLQNHLLVLEGNVCEPWHGFNSCQEMIKQCYNILANCHLVD